MLANVESPKASLQMFRVDFYSEQIWLCTKIYKVKDMDTCARKSQETVDLLLCDMCIITALEPSQYALY